MELLLAEILNKIAGRISYGDRRYNQAGFYMEGLLTLCAGVSVGR
jgi:hypothetical protein